MPTVPPMLRIGGHLHPVPGDPPTQEELASFIASMAPPRYKDIVEASFQGLDFSHELPSLCRFRCTACSAKGQLGLVMRVIRTTIPSIQSLHLPDVIMDIAMSLCGSTLVTGTTGSGKSTTLAAMIDLINTNDRAKIITVEDPIEYLHVNKESMIMQHEVGSDTPSFDQALPGARQDPDVILIPGNCAMSKPFGWCCGRPIPGIRCSPPSTVRRGPDHRAHHRDVPAAGNTSCSCPSRRNRLKPLFRSGSFPFAKRGNAARRWRSCEAGR